MTPSAEVEGELLPVDHPGPNAATAPELLPARPAPEARWRAYVKDTRGPLGYLPAYVDEQDDDEDDDVPAEVDQALLDAIPKNTRKQVEYQWPRFVRWCVRNERPFDPPTIGTIRYYIWAHMTMTKRDGTLCGLHGQPYAPSTVETALGVICTVLQWQGYASPWKHPKVRKQLAAYEREWRKAGFRPNVSHAITLDENIAMVRSRNMSNVAGIRDAAMLALHRAMGCRASELCDLDEDDIRFETPEKMLVYIRDSKGGKARTVAVEADTGDEETGPYAPDADAVLLVSQWLELKHSRGITGGRLFTQVKVGGPRKPGGGITGVITALPLDRHAYEQIHTKAVKAAGVDRDARGKKRHVSTHGNRAGFITDGLDAGVPAERIRPITGHAEGSTVFFRYYRSAHRWGEHNPLRTTRRVFAARRQAQSGRGR